VVVFLSEKSSRKIIGAAATAIDPTRTQQ